MIPQTNSRAHILFGEYELDCETGELRRSGTLVKLQPQPAKLLNILVNRPGEVVTRQELAEQVWGSETYVDFEHGLNFAIRQIRSVLEDDAEHPRFLETVPKRGYRFIAPVSNQPQRTDDKRSRVQPLPPRKSSLRYLLAALAVTGLATTLIVMNNRGVALYKRAGGMVGSRKIESLAVLPLHNLSANAEQEYFSDGMTDQLITDLAKFRNLRVISHTSVQRYKNTKQSLPEIAKELGVDAVVEGTVARSGDRIRITAQLIDARLDRHLWAESYERDLQDILALQDEVAHDISAEIRLELTPQEQPAATVRKINPKAYDAYMRGRYLWGQRNGEAITKAVGYFQQAVQEEPDFALAYSGLSDCYSVRWRGKTDFPRAEAYARKALSLQPDLAEGHVSLGLAHLFQYKMADAGGELRRALELNPNNAMASHFYADYLLAIGRPAEALAENDRARQLDPFSLPINTMRGLILTGLREYDQALNQLERTAEIAPQAPSLHNFLARIYWLEGRAPEAIAEERKEGTLAHSSERLRDLEEVAAAYAKSGLRAAQVRSAQLMELHQDSNSQAILIAFQYGTLENEAKVLQWLERSSRAQESNLVLLAKTAPELDFLRTNPRFQDLFHRVGLQP